ncbi:patatin-like phospholipase family protein [Pseudothauera nasutitermitis]|uniref:Patatin-like phospholipase family protein n=1 Tax=Pseudothauera nasutitermitis TaxID=2565930 RepID=A0A4S4ATH8_9RHOO|nr:patatin-like phospholipase family protein [Pseudothauera nasutitermitis]THF63172.1 patatin-like phospholipase family protein [Pseudothauera nasutitermitis]
MGQQTERAALVLTGGGARAAYQVGVLAAIRELRGGQATGNPFPILCGTSAGGINAAALAVYADDFNAAVRRLTRIWRNFHVERVYRTDPAALFGTGLRWGGALTLGWAIRQTPRSLLDNSPLRALLERVLDFSRIGRAIDAGHLYAVSVTASGYTSGESLAFFEAVPEVQPWRRAQRVGVRERLGVDHLLATSALPFVFPAVRIHREYFGDGSMRQLSPISPAIHLGAERILVVGAGRLAEEGRQRTDNYPSLAQIAGHALSSIFLDGLAVDLERLARINATVGALSPAQRAAAGIALRPIETLVISPSRRLDTIAGHHRGSLPRLLRTLLRGVGAMRRDGSTLLSYLLFEPGFTRALIELGYADTLARRGEVSDFLRL